MRCKTIITFVLSIFLFGLISASYQFSEEGSSVIRIYQSNDTLEINLNISFSNEPLNSTFHDSIGNSIELGELLELDEDYVVVFDDLTNTTVSSAFQNLKLTEAEFNIDKPVGNITYRLNLNTDMIFEMTLQILSNKNLIEQKLEDKYSELNDTITEISKQDLFVQSILNEYLNLDDIDQELMNLETAYENAETSEEYAQITSNLSLIKIPKSISLMINTNSIRFYPSEENVKLDVLREVGGGSYGNEEEGYKGAIYNWNDANLKTTLTFREIAINYNAYEQVTLRIFRFEFDKTKMVDDAYFIVEKFPDIIFEGTSGAGMQESNSGYLYTLLRQAPNTITFATSYNVDFLSIPAFTSPSLSNLSPPEKLGKFEEWIDNSRTKWILFAVIVIILLLIGAIIYVLIHSWYRKKYEAHLFKTRNNLFNIMTYIQNAKKKGMSRDETIENLKKAGWTGEQISYAMRKYEGKKILGLIRNPVNLTPEAEKKIQEKNPSPRLPPHNPSPTVNKPFNPITPSTPPTVNNNNNPPIQKKPDQNNPNKNTKV